MDNRAGDELIKYGPTKAEGDEGLDEEVVGGTITGEPMIKGPNYAPDPTGRRTGEAPNQQVAQGTRCIREELPTLEQSHRTSVRTRSDVNHAFRRYASCVISSSNSNR